jgi:RWD domain
MADHAEEQEMEAEAMAAIFDSHFDVLEPTKWSVTIYPESGDPSELDTLNHVGCKLLVNLPETYPEVCPELDIEIVKGLAEEQRLELKQLADEEATANQGVPSVFAVTERLREWLIVNNVKGLDDVSMHAQMMRKKLQAEKSQVRYVSAAVVFNLVGLQASLRSKIPRSLDIQQCARVRDSNRERYLHCLCCVHVSRVGTVLE